MDHDVKKMSKEELVKVALKVIEQKNKLASRQKKYRVDKIAKGYKRLVLYVPKDLHDECKKLVKEFVDQKSK